MPNFFFRKGFSDQKVWAILKFLENYVLFEDPEMNRIFSEQIKSTDKNNVMGIVEFVKQEGIEQGIKTGIEIGRDETKRVFVQNLLREGNFSVEKIASVANVTVEVVNELKDGLIAQ